MTAIVLGPAKADHEKAGRQARLGIRFATEKNGVNMNVLMDQRKVTKAARNGARGPRESPRTRRSERKPANIASKELHVVTCVDLIRHLNFLKNSLIKVPVQGLMKVFRWVIREPCVLPHTNSEKVALVSSLNRQM